MPPSLFPSRLARALALAVTPVLGAAVLGLQAPAGAAITTCQAINATSIVSNIPPSPSCGSVSVADGFILDFSNIFASQGGQLPIDKFYSLQIANLTTGSPTPLKLKDVKFLVSGVINSNPVTLEPITIWDQTQPTFPFAQGLTNYATGGGTGTFTPPGSMTPINVADTLALTLTGPVPPSALGSAALINTLPIRLDEIGVSSFTGAQIIGTFDGPITPFSAGLALFDAFPTPGVAPNTVYGNAFFVPGPLPIFGAGAAYGWSRRLRRRVASASA
jgi:hypothetical protein